MYGIYVMNSPNKLKEGDKIMKFFLRD